VATQAVPGWALAGHPGLSPRPGRDLPHAPWEKEPLAVLMLSPYPDGKSWQERRFVRQRDNSRLKQKNNWLCQ